MDEACGDERAHLVLEPLRWALALMPRWIVLEQVPPVLPLWEAMCAVLRSRGYSAVCGILSAEQFGVPQTRKRAFLIASLDGPVRMPAPTHQRYIAPRRQRGYGEAPAPTLVVGNGTGELAGGSNSRKARERRAIVDGPMDTLFEPPEPERIVAPEDRGLLPWVSMAQALGWDRSDRVGFPRRAASDTGWDADTAPTFTAANGVEYRERDLRTATEPAFADRGGALVAALPSGHERQRRNGARLNDVSWVLRSGQSVAGEGRAERDADAPSLSVISRFDLCEWVTERPATTVDGDPRISEPGHHDAEVSGSQQANAVRVSLQEALVLQDFDPATPVQGSKSKAFEQVGNAVPVGLALAAVRVVV